MLLPLLQFAQWARDLSFRLFDYGSAAANRQHYGTDRPPSMAGVNVCARVRARVRVHVRVFACVITGCAGL